MISIQLFANQEQKGSLIGGLLEKQRQETVTDEEKAKGRNQGPRPRWLSSAPTTGMSSAISSPNTLGRESQFDISFVFLFFLNQKVDFT